MHLKHVGDHHGRDHIVVGFIDYLCNQCLSPLQFKPR
jgi:hypothetical protein